MSTFRSLKNRSFALLWSGQTLSRLGDFVYEIALSWWILEETGSAEAMGVMWVFVATPSVLLLLLGGAVVDRFSRIRLMLISDVGRALIVAIVAALAYFDQLQLWHIYATSFFFGMVDAFFNPAYIAIIPQIVPEDDLASANAWISILVFSLTNVTLIGPYIVAMPFLVSDFMKEDVTRLGLILSIFPIGYVIGGTWLGRYHKLPRRGILMNTTLALAAIMLGLYGLHLPLWVLIVAALINGIALQAGSLAWTTILQEKIPNEQLGRVSSIDQMGSIGLMPVGLYLAGVLTETIGPSPVFLLGGALTALVGLLAITHPAIRNLD